MIHLLDDTGKRPRAACRAKVWESLSSERKNVTCVDCVFVPPLVAKLIAGKVTWCGGVAKYR